MLLYTNINRKPYMGSPMTLLHLNLSDLERSVSRSLRFQTLISRKAAEFGHICYYLTPIRNHIWDMGSPKPPSHLTLSDPERSKLRCQI